VTDPPKRDDAAARAAQKIRKHTDGMFWRDIAAIIREEFAALEEKNRWLRADHEDQIGQIHRWMKRHHYPRPHFCDDWDGLLIGPGDPEFEECCSHRAALAATEKEDD